MEGIYEDILELFQDLQTDLKGENLNIDINAKEKAFKCRKFIFQKLSLKVIVTGCTSVGKSTLINKLIKRDIYGSESLHGTTAFFYTTATTKGYEYFMINDSHEIKNIETLRNATRLDLMLKDYINEDTEIKTYLISDKNEFLKKCFVIVDSPGLEQEQNYKQKIIDQCECSDIVVYVFDVGQRARIQDLKFIQEICKKNPDICLYFVYNKCDTVNLNETLMASLRNDFHKTFEQIFKTKQMAKGNLYFLSLTTPTTNGSVCDEEFERFKNDISAFINVGFIRYHNSISQTIKDLKEVDGALVKLLKTKNNMAEKTLSNETLDNNTNESMKLHIRKEADDSITLFKQKNMVYNIEQMVISFTQTCNKYSANEMVTAMKASINKEIGNILQIHLNLHFHQHIVTSKYGQYVSDMKNDMFQLTENKDFLNTNINTNIFWPHESGDKTNKTKNHFVTLISKNSVAINNYIRTFYTDEVNRILKVLQTHLETKIDLMVSQQNKNNIININMAKIKNAIGKHSDKIKKLLNLIRSNLESSNSGL